MAAIAQHELMPCGITVITDAMTLAGEPDALKQVGDPLSLSCRCVLGLARRNLEHGPCLVELGERTNAGCGIAVLPHDRMVNAHFRLAHTLGSLLQLFGKLKQGGAGCARVRHCSPCGWGVKMSPVEHSRLEDAYRRSHQVNKLTCNA